MKKVGLLLALVAVVAIAVLPRVNVLVVEHVQEHRQIIVQEVEPGDEFSMRWIHSVELLPWEEIFRIGDDHNIYLDRTRFKQFGAGVPDYAGTKTEIVDGYIVFSGIDKKMDLIPYGVSHFAKHTFFLGNIEARLYELIKDGDRVDIYTTKIGILRYLLSKLTTPKF